jgi:hypothetical protein
LGRSANRMRLTIRDRDQAKGPAVNERRSGV